MHSRSGRVSRKFMCSVLCERNMLYTQIYEAHGTVLIILFDGKVMQTSGMLVHNLIEPRERESGALFATIYISTFRVQCAHLGWPSVCCRFKEKLSSSSSTNMRASRVSLCTFRCQFTQNLALVAVAKRSLLRAFRIPYVSWSVYVSFFSNISKEEGHVIFCYILPNCDVIFIIFHL